MLVLVVVLNTQRGLVLIPRDAMTHAGIAAKQLGKRRSLTKGVHSYVYELGHLGLSQIGFAVISRIEAKRDSSVVLAALVAAMFAMARDDSLKWLSPTR